MSDEGLALIPTVDGVITGKDDHETLADLPGGEALRALWNPGALEMLDPGPVKGPRVTEKSGPQIQRMTKFLGGRLSKNSHTRARGIVPSGAVSAVARQQFDGHVRICAHVQGTSATPYRVTLTWPADGHPETGRGLTNVVATCSCPMSGGRPAWCKHSAAVLYLLPTMTPKD